MRWSATKTRPCGGMGPESTMPSSTAGGAVRCVLKPESSALGFGTSHDARHSASGSELHSEARTPPDRIDTACIDPSMHAVQEQMPSVALDGSGTPQNSGDSHGDGQYPVHRQ